MGEASREDDRDVLLYRARDSMEAALLVAMLEGSGVPARAVGGQAALALGDLPSDALLVDIRVFERDHAHAIGLVHQYFARTDESEGAEPWDCDGCGELIEDSFTSCWKCGTPRYADDPAPTEIERPGEGSAGYAWARDPRWDSWTVKVFRGVIAFGALGLLLVSLLACFQGVVVEVSSLVVFVVLVTALYYAVPWVLGWRDRPRERGA